MADQPRRADEQLVRLSDLVGQRVLSAAGERRGRLTDVVIRAQAERPTVRELVVRDGDEATLPWSAVRDIDRSGVHLADGADRVPSTGPPAATDLRLARDVLDVQIVDLEGHRLVRVADVLLVPEDSDLVVFGVDTGFGAVVRRLGFRRLGDRLRPEVVLWSGLHLTSRQGHAAQLALRSAHLQRLSPDDLAHLLSLLTVPHAIDVLGQTSVDSAAGAIVRSRDEVGRRLLAALPEEHADELLEAMPEPRAHRLRHLLQRTPVPRRRYHRTRGWSATRPRPTASRRRERSRDRARHHRPLIRRRTGVLAILAVLGPGLLAGLSDDDPAGITTYAVLGASHGYQLLWVLLLSTVALVLFHDLAARMGVITGQGLIGLVRQRFGLRVSLAALILLLVANLGTTAAEFAGIAAGFELFGIPRQISVPIAAVMVSVLVLRGSFHRVEHLLLALGSVFVTYAVAAVVAHPDWGAAVHGLVVPSMPLDAGAIGLATATVGTTLAPWGLSFMQSYAVDKKLTPDDLRYERVDVVTGAALTGIIGFFVVVTCAATLHVHGVEVDSAAAAAQSLEPVAGHFASGLFAVGLIGAAILAASILPLSTAYSVCEFVGSDAAVDDKFRDARLFYITFGLTTAIAAGLVLLPGAPLIAILVATQALNAIVLLPLLVLMHRMARDPNLLGEHRVGRLQSGAYLATIGFIGACVAALGLLAL